VTPSAKRRRARPDDLIAASEIASYAFCPEAWRLQHGLGLPAGNQAEMDAGVRHHARKAVAERAAGGAIGLGKLMLAVGLALLVLWVLMR
jgi:hypothetical protein